MDFDKLMEYQNLMQQRLRTEQQIDKKIELLTIINHLTMGPKNIVQKESIRLALKEALPQRYHHLLSLNERAIEIGMNLVS